MRRILLVLSVAALMAAMMMATAMPAFGGKQYAKGLFNTNEGFTQDSKGDAKNEVCEQNGSRCGTPRYNPHGVYEQPTEFGITKASASKKVLRWGWRSPLGL
jgi:hypothetical protein